MIWNWPRFAKLANPYVEAIEARLVAGTMTDDRVLEIAVDLCVEDFTNPWNKEAFAAIRNIQARGECVDVLAVVDEIERTDFERDRNVRLSVNATYLGLLILDTQTYRTDYAFERRDGRTWINGIEVDWQALLQIEAGAATFVKATVDDRRIAAVNRLRATESPDRRPAEYDRAECVDDLTDAQLAQVKVDTVLADIKFLRYAKANPLPLTPPQEVHVQDNDRRIRKQRQSHHRRARGATR